jgi:hypothetical protein
MITEKQIEMRRIEIAKSGNKEWARRLVIDYLARGKVAEAVVAADKSRLLLEVPEKYLRQAAEAWLNNDNGDEELLQTAARVFDLLGDKQSAKVARINLREIDDAMSGRGH